MSRMFPLYDGIKLNCTIVSDTHIDEKHPYPWLPMYRLNQTLKSAQKSISPVDAYVTVGDTTSRGSIANWEMTLKCFKRFSPAKNIILTIGNHDCWNDDGFNAAVNNFFDYSKKICGIQLTKPYFSNIINGYHIICLGNDEDSGCEAHISDEQMEWFRAEMESASSSNKPVFVFCHQSLNQKHGLPKTWDKSEEYDSLQDGGIGERSDEIEAILKSYKNVFYFSGHSHMGLGGEITKEKYGFASIEEEDGLTLINLPSLACGNHHGEDRHFGVGLQLEVYENRVVIRPRNFNKQKWIKRVMFKNNKPYFEKSMD